ncbi:hypothetical protein LMH87_004014 [Akanthomyces muscarius]|uniref:Uncharacterized protein n=1 Tax=Akanthomyces muscarius TaxID=2231603 RepID=A0A9W8UGN4_AKAMU|nr:hypothetical protein LMH87_004014 [Akanthomyces muscarius]KAJ4145156.1 hypothetical protein LMH87_004014 [Akanthomyces muscarius]
MIGQSRASRGPCGALYHTVAVAQVQVGKRKASNHTPRFSRLLTPDLGKTKLFFCSDPPLHFGPTRASSRPKRLRFDMCQAVHRSLHELQAMGSNN